MTKTDAPTRPWALALLLVSLFGIAACNTMEGAGQDIEAAGEGLSDTADEAQDEL